jgi:hypothetical protein
VGLPQPGVGVLRRHPAEVRPELGDVAAVLRKLLLLGGAQRVLDQGVLIHRPPQLCADLGLGHDLRCRPQDAVRQGTLLERHRCLASQGARASRAIAGLAAGEQHHVGAAQGDVASRPAEQGRLEHAHLGHLRARSGRAEALGQQATRVGVAPEAPRRADRVGAGQQLAAARIFGCGLEGTCHQLQRLDGALGVFLALLHGGNADEHGGSGVAGH